MKLSICIPTYNRGRFLKENIERLLESIRKSHLESNINLFISDNGSTDETESICKMFEDNTRDIGFKYFKNDTNLGPDVNYIKAMHMATGNYTILLGDDDYIKQNGLNEILNLINKYPTIDVFLSNRTEIGEDGTILRECKFLREDIDSKVFDFSNDIVAGYYFTLCKAVGGCLTFISSIIYKTSILKEIGEYDGSLDGTYYSFWFYLWGKLSSGGKLFYYNNSYILNTQVYNLNFGRELDRMLVEYIGFYRASELFFKEKPYRKDFLYVPKRTLSIRMLLIFGLRHPKTYTKSFIPLIEKSEWEDYEVNDMKAMFQVSFYAKGLFFKLLPGLAIKLREWYYRIS